MMKDQGKQTETVQQYKLLEMRWVLGLYLVYSAFIQYSIFSWISLFQLLNIRFKIAQSLDTSIN